MIKTLVELHEALSKGCDLEFLGILVDHSQLDAHNTLDVSSSLRLFEDDTNVLYLYVDSSQTLFKIITSNKN